MQVIFSRSLAARLEGTGVTSNSLEPGVVNTGLSQGITDDPAMRKRLENGVSVEEGARCQIFLAASGKASGESGGNWEDCEDISKGLAKAKYIVAAPFLSQKMHEGLWKATEELISSLEQNTPSGDGTREGEPSAEPDTAEPEPEAEAAAEPAPEAEPTMRLDPMEPYDPVVRQPSVLRMCPHMQSNRTQHNWRL